MLAKLILIIGFTPVATAAAGQAKSLRYEIKEKIYYLDSLYICIQSEFQVTRLFGQNKQFFDRSFMLYGKDTIDKHIDTFKIEDHKWYIFLDKTWKLFFSEAQFKKNIPIFSHYLFPTSDKLFPYKIVINKNGSKNYIYQLEPKKNFSKIHYVFDPKKGFISAEIGDGCELILIE